MLVVGWLTETVKHDKVGPFASKVIQRSKLCYSTSNFLPLYFTMTNPCWVQRDGSASS